MAKNNDAYLVNFVGKFLEGYATGKKHNMDYKEKLAVAELDKKSKDEKSAADKKQQDFENALKIDDAFAKTDASGRTTEYIDDKGQKHTTSPLTPEQVASRRSRIVDAVRSRGYNDYPGLPPLPVPAAASDGVPPYLARNPEQQPPPLPSQAPLPAPSVPVPADPAKIAKYPTFNDDSTRQDAERRRYQASLSQDYEREAKPFKEASLAYGDARGAYQRAQLASKTGQSSSVADKDLVLAMVSARQGSRISDADFRLASEQGSVDEKVANYYSMAVKGQMTPAIRDQIFKLTRDALVSREKEYKTNVEDHFTRKTQELVPGLDPSLVVRKIRPVDWEDIKKDYDKEYGGATAPTWDEAKERRYQELKRKMEQKGSKK